MTRRRQVMPSRSLLIPMTVSMSVLLSGCFKKEAEEEVPAEKAAEVAESLVASDAPLESFCGLTVGGQTLTEPMVMDCSCCSTFMRGDYADQVELLYGSHRAMARARDLDGKVAGEVPIWSLGDDVPEVVCKSGPKGPEAFCECANQDKTWAEFEPACGVGESCTKDVPPREWPAVVGEGEASTERDAALGRDGGDGGSTSGAGSDSGKQCAAPVPPEKAVSGLKVARRVSLGSSGRCKDMAPEQCHLFYAKVGSEWKYCEETSTDVRQCSALFVPQAKSAAETAQLEAWAVKNAYLPDAWPVQVKADGTMEPSSTPTREEFLKHLGNLPSKMQKTYVA